MLKIVHTTTAIVVRWKNQTSAVLALDVTVKVKMKQFAKVLKKNKKYKRKNI